MLARRVLGRTTLGLLPAAAHLGLTARALAAPASSAPPTAYLVGDAYVERYKQMWALSCEFAALHTALRLLGQNVSEDVMRGVLGRGEDLDETFRGEIQANQTLDNYGVHARGIARLVDLLKAQGHLPAGYSWRLLHDLESVRLALAQSQPVVTWLPLGLRASSRAPVRLSNGKTVNLVYSEHCVTIRGYDGTYFYALEPYDGSTPAYEANALWRGMSLFDDPALAIVPEPAVAAAPPAPAPAPAPEPAPAPAPAPTSMYFPETGITLDGGFYAAYVDLGGKQALGLPLTSELSEPDASGAGKQVLYTEAARLEWHPDSGTFGVGFSGQEVLGDSAHPDPSIPVGGAIRRYFEQHGGLQRFGYPISHEVPIPATDTELLPWPIYDAIGQWFQTGLLIWDPYGREVVPGRTGYLLAKVRGYLGSAEDPAREEEPTPDSQPNEAATQRRFWFF